MRKRFSRPIREKKPGQMCSCIIGSEIDNVTFQVSLVVVFFPESERTGPPVGGRPHSTARALPGGRVRVGPGGSAR